MEFIRAIGSCAGFRNLCSEQDPLSKAKLASFTKPPEKGPYVVFCHFPLHNYGLGHSALNVYHVENGKQKILQSVNFVQHRACNHNPLKYSYDKSNMFYYIPLREESIEGFKEWYQDSFSDRHSYGFFSNNCAVAARASMEKLGMDLSDSPWIERPWELLGSVETYLLENFETLKAVEEESKTHSSNHYFLALFRSLRV